ncbi:hypothetical protein FACS1894205_1080 [Alphaproteobacteria bacterium]|nr:hypothetical protein FACS1894205_1080 [Alphaproteobacteria bacterium]
MIPLLPFVSGIVVGAIGVRLLKGGNLCKSAGAGFDKAESGLRSAAISGLETIRKTSESLQSKLERDPAKSGDKTASDSAKDNEP